MNTVKILSYNIHSCRNMDRRYNPARTAKKIAGFHADIIALQEVDVGHRRSGYINQAAYIADHLDMSFDFFTLKESPSGRYGLAILSRFPIHDLNCGTLPAAFAAKPVENRGVMMAHIETPLGYVRVLNTHLGLRAKDRKLQAAALAGSRWVCNDRASSVPVILCGDFNAGPGSVVYKTISRHLADIQKVYKNRRYPRPTFASWLPVRRIDHIFISRHFSVKDVKVPMDYETRMVSDHLPLYGEIAVTPS
ncbi:MAG: endonuclease/exonuclease/phosphatase family protein [Desulfobacteraceae bacterium]|nr:endonuclease/exonuclease/phosphatase family protein [Desulfobacteraceae bacterium]